jgi:hypothetical protein
MGEHMVSVKYYSEPTHFPSDPTYTRLLLDPTSSRVNRIGYDVLGVLFGRLRAILRMFFVTFVFGSVLRIDEDFQTESADPPFSLLSVDGNRVQQPVI